jgi:hypothetical protein
MSSPTPNSLFDIPPQAPRKAKNVKRAFEETLVTLTQLAQMVGAKPRALQLWTDGGALKPLEGTDRKGSGAWRLYTHEECELAAILAQVHLAFRLPVGELAALAQALRQILTQAGSREAFDRARKGAHAVWLVGAPRGDDGFDIGFATGTVLSLGSAAGGQGGLTLRDKPAILVINLTQALGKLKFGA